MSQDDFTAEVKRWLILEHELDKTIAHIPMLAGLSWGLALAARHPEYAAEAHIALTTDYKERAAGGQIEFQVMAVASGDERTSSENLADGLVEAVEIRT